MNERFNHLCRAITIRTVVIRFPFVSNESRTASRTMRNHRKGGERIILLILDRADYFWDDIACFAYDNLSTYTDVAMPNEVLVMERCPLDRRPHDLNRFEYGEGRNGARPAYIKNDIL